MKVKRISERPWRPIEVVLESEQELFVFLDILERRHIHCLRPPKAISMAEDIRHRLDQIPME